MNCLSLGFFHFLSGHQIIVITKTAEGKTRGATKVVPSWTVLAALADDPPFKS